MLLLLSCRRRRADAFGGGYRGVALAVAAVFAARLLATLLFGAVLLGPLAALTALDGPLDRRWTMIGADGLRLALLIVAPLWITWTPDTRRHLAAGHRLRRRRRRAAVGGRQGGAAPELLPPRRRERPVRPAARPPGRPPPALLRTGFVALPLAAAALVVVTLINKLLATGVDWFDLHQVALASYVAAGLFASCGGGR